MLKFVWFSADQQAAAGELRGAHLVGNDGVPVRGEFRTGVREIHCIPRAEGPVALSVLWPVNGYGAVQLETTRLPERERPYVLNLELARHRLMRITLKREEWGLFDYRGMDEISGKIDEARDRFVAALQAADDPPTAARLADESLKLSLWAGEQMCNFHAGVFLGRRHQGAGFGQVFLGAAVSPASSPEGLSDTVREAIDFVRIPFTWREIQPKEQTVSYDKIDSWIEACAATGLFVRGGPLLNFGVQSVPDWMYIWENDFDTIRDYAHEHVRRSLKRYGEQINSWVVASGLHADNVFSFNFEQIMEITRAATSAVKQLAPRSQIVLDLTQPWGEYSARNPRSIPPMLYADLAAQSGISFDAFGLQFVFGIDSDGYYLRDVLQISSLIDKLANLGKPLHITAVGVPSSAMPPDDTIGGGQWHGPWSDQSQAEWLTEFCEVALSKPYVECVCLQALADNRHAVIPTGGVLREDYSPKPAFSSLTELRRRLNPGPTR